MLKYIKKLWHKVIYDDAEYVTNDEFIRYLYTTSNKDCQVCNYNHFDAGGGLYTNRCHLDRSKCAPMFSRVCANCGYTQFYAHYVVKQRIRTNETNN